MNHNEQHPAFRRTNDRSIAIGRRQFMRASLAATATCLLGSRAALPGAASRERPNVILAMTDDQGWADVGYYGNREIRTPVLDEMASSGIRFDRFYAAHPVCSPTRGSCLTGRHPNRYGCFSWGYDLPLPEVTLAEVLKRAGYATGHFGKWHLGGIPTVPGRKDRTNRGKMAGAEARHPGNQGFDEWFSFWNFFDLNPAHFYHNGEAVGPLQGDGSDITVDRTVEWIKRVLKQRQPFFAVVWFGNPHSPHRALPTDKELYGHVPENKRDYMGEITGVDRAMGTLRKALRDMGVADNTLLWFCSDNGGTKAANNGGLKGFKGSLWEGGIRVPGILEWPARVPRPFATDVPAFTSDFYPTILDLVGVEAPDNQPKPLDGISLVPLIDGRMKERPEPMAFEVRRNRKDVVWAALVDNRFKLHTQRGKRNAGAKQGPGVQTLLYDLAGDPGETTDVAAGHPDIVARMKARLEKWQKSVERSLAGEDYK